MLCHVFYFYVGFDHWVLGIGCMFYGFIHSIVIFIFTMNSSILLRQMKLVTVSIILCSQNSFIEIQIPLLTMLARTLSIVFSVPISSISLQFPSTASFKVVLIPYFVSNFGCRDRFSYTAARIARIWSFMTDPCSKSASIENTVIRNFLVNGKQNLGLLRMSSAMQESTKSILRWVAASSALSSSSLPRRVKWFIILRINKGWVMKRQVQPFWKREVRVRRQSQNCSPSDWAMDAQSWAMAAAAAASWSQLVVDETSQLGFSSILCKQEGQDSDVPDVIWLLLFVLQIPSDNNI